jgi:NitT/TauT family transport system substrate-binding protein
MRQTVLFPMMLFWILASGAGASETGLKRASFLPHWVPQAQFAGYYVAFEKGFYRNRGIDLVILPGGPERPSSSFLAEGKADFASLWLSTALRMAAAGREVVNIGQIVQRSALMLVAKKSRGIHTPRDLNGRKVSLWGDDFQIQPKAFFRKYGLAVTVVPQSSSVNLFLRDGVDAASAMWYNEYHTILNAGIDPGELTTFFFHDHGLNFPEDGLYTLGKTLRQDPGLAAGFVAASLEGWSYAFSHGDETLDIVLKYMAGAKIPANRVHQRWMLDRMKDLLAPSRPGDPVGMLREEDYGNAARELVQAGWVKSATAWPAFFKGGGPHVAK